MKKFITVIPLQGKGQLRRYRYRAADNRRLQMEEAISFPILTAVSGYLEPGEPSRLIALAADTEDGRRNLAALREQLGELCAARGLTPPEIVSVPMAEGDSVAAQVDAFQRLIDHAEDDDELFACLTYGTKPLSQAVLMAVRYAYRIKRNASVACIVYGSVDRSGGGGPETWTGTVYDETALVRLDEIVRVLADRGVEDPKRVLDGILSL